LKLAKLNGKPELFYTVQGEGKNIGKPSVFVRLSLCNLHCHWCDTDYTWNWEGTRFLSVKNVKFKRSEQIINMTPAEVMAEIKKYNCQNIVLTGGEPMLQQDALLAMMMLEPTYNYEVETNGTIRPKEYFNEMIAQYNVSPKLENSQNSKEHRERPQVLKFFAKNPKTIFKFVIVTPDDLKEVENLIAEYEITKIYLMPEGVTQKELQERSAWLVEICKERGWNFTTRLQVILWDRKRGV
jgi:organic radical activating enzyme